MDIRPRIIAVDFDGCLCENAWPEIGAPRQAVIDALLERKKVGVKIILWTCRVGERLDAAVKWCADRGITFDAINANLPENIESFGNDCRKVFADEYWDDKAVVVRSASISPYNKINSYGYWEARRRLQNDLIRVCLQSALPIGAVTDELNKTESRISKMFFDMSILSIANGIVPPDVGDRENG